jgi:predicted DNA-binding transcriptional regulator AlpA
MTMRQHETPQPALNLVRLVDREQLARALDVKLSHIPQHTQLPDFPSPVAYYRGRSLWQAAAVEAWANRRGCSNAHNSPPPA